MMEQLIEDKKISTFLKILTDSRRIAVVPHVNPDGDAIGSSMALFRILRNIGKNVDVVIPNDFPDFLNWIEDSDKVINFNAERVKAETIINKADLLFILDFNNFERSGEMVEALKGHEGFSIMIDHHPLPVAPCDMVISDTSQSSTCELMFRVIADAGLNNYIDKSAAEAIFTGMMTDTGNFSYNASSPDTYRIIAALLEKGIDKDQVHANVFHTFSADRWRLIGHSLKEKMVIIPEMKTGYISLSKTELEQYNYESGDTEGLVNYPLMVKGIVFCVLFTEMDDFVKVS
ncbi:MAG TPA: DHH family phosphoesterase, partial [Prolixibacteraceae bacterium]|nr:DHH family phosphoesterase [Prolixibacteraceae bacterium]